MTRETAQNSNTGTLDEIAGRQRIMWRRTRAVPGQSTISQNENEQALTGVDSFADIPSEDAVICSLTLVGMRVRQIQSRNLTNVSI